MNNLDHNLVLVESGPNCFVAAFEAFLKNSYQHSSLIANRHLGLFYTNKSPGNYRSGCIAGSLIGDILQSIKEVEKSVFVINTDRDMESAHNQLIEMLKSNSSVLIFVDTFFLEYFPKEKGHTLHAMLASQLDLNCNSVFVSCSLPHKGMIDLKKLAIARNSKIDRNWISNAWLECRLFNWDMTISERYVISGIESNVRTMTRDEKNVQKGIFGIPALKMFKEDFVLYKNTLAPEEFNQFLNNIFSQSLFISDERKRYAKYLGEISHLLKIDLVDLILLYNKIGYHWDIFRNLCFKCSISSEIDNNKLIERLNILIEQEEKGVEGLALLTRRSCEKLTKQDVLVRNRNE